ncbi:PLP-dependent cysteine synthase family protein [Paenibacillus sp. RC84]|uniref:PLP-dependent cysteine synthase family protein n=1 Tax=Paenibacillus sp. RC84 TaxID=3156252 RepID=UPI0035125B8E
MIHTDITECIGNTPVVSLNDELVPLGKKLYLKLDYFNPNFSIKDRTALGLVKAAMAEGKIRPGSILIESTSGNLGKSLAMLGAVYGFKVIIVVDPKVSASLLKWYQAYGAEVDMVTTPAPEGGFQRARLNRVRQLLDKYPGAFWSNQYDNPSNPAYHAETTAREIADLPVDSIVGAVSTGGHLCGIGKYVKKHKPHLHVVACDVAGSAVFGQPFAPYLINGVGLSWRSANTDTSVLDAVSISSDQEAISVCRLLARDHGILMGGSGGLTVFTALAWLQHSDASSALAIIPDAGTNYLDQIYDDEWLTAKEIKLLGRGELEERLEHKAFTNLLKQETLT